MASLIGGCVSQQGVAFQLPVVVLMVQEHIFVKIPEMKTIYA
jgi:hypothetical protein